MTCTPSLDPKPVAAPPRSARTFRRSLLASLLSLALGCDHAAHPAPDAGWRDAATTNDDGGGNHPDDGGQDEDGGDPDGGHDGGDADSGDDDGGGDALVFGTFAFGTVVGLRYETATTSGLTDGEGRFRYREGEVVTFSVGGIVLGSVPGSARISPFDLRTMAPLASEASLRGELALREDVSDFDEVANIAYLLASLDVDDCLATGVDLSGWDAVLGAATLELGVPMYAFPEGDILRLARRYGVHRGVPITAPLVHLYRALDVVVPVGAVDTAPTFYVDGTQPFGVETYTYDAEGRTTRLVWDETDDGDPEESYETEYDPSGRVERETDVVALVSGEWATAERVYAYDALGNVVRFEETIDAGQPSEAHSAATFTYDARGNRATGTWRSASGETTTVVETYDAVGNDVQTVRAVVASGESVTVTRTFDARGELETARSVHERPPLLDIALTAVTRDASGRRLVLETSYDDGANGTVDSTDRVTDTYDPDVDTLTTRVTRTAIGTRQEEIRSETFDTLGRMRMRVDERRISPGVFRRFRSVLRAFDERGDLDRVLTESFPGSGLRFFLDDAHAHAYDAEARLQVHTVARTSDDPRNASIWRYTFRYRQIADGVLYLVAFYAPEPERVDVLDFDAPTVRSDPRSIPLTRSWRNPRVQRPIPALPAVPTYSPAVHVASTSRMPTSFREGTQNPPR